ncbi:hypothetical protein ABPG74_021700 [Tetrahymena malaccensis]
MKQISIQVFLLLLSLGIVFSAHKVEVYPINGERVTAFSIVDNNAVAKAFYTNALNTTGWTILSIETNGKFSDRDQLYHAGYLEGYLTYDLINYAYYNFLNTVLNGQELNELQQQFVTNQTQWIEGQLQQHNQTSQGYWGLVGSLMSQLNGTYDGYVEAMKKNQQQQNILSFNQFYYLTNMGDLEDIQNAVLKTNKTEKNCDAYVKLTKNDLVCAHSTFNIYSLMLRVYKAYNFQFHNKDVKASFQAFSSRPGDLESKDDFYILNNGIVVMETSLNNYNKTNYDYLHYNSVPCWMRVNLANRLSSNTTEWAQVFSNYRSGTHNNQWIVVDYNQWRKGSKENIVWMVEESFYLYKPIDITQQLFSQGYVASYNVPFNQEIYNITMYQQGYGFNYTNDPRAIEFAEYSKNVSNTKDVMKLIRSNHNATGDPSDAIAPRFDLLNQGAYTYGAIDAKVTNDSLLKDLQSFMISSPTNDGLPYFSWNNWESVPHQGMPDNYNFDWIKYNYSTQNYTFVEHSSQNQIKNLRVESQ